MKLSICLTVALTVLSIAAAPSLRSSVHLQERGNFGAPASLVKAVGSKVPHGRPALHRPSRKPSHPAPRKPPARRPFVRLSGQNQNQQNPRPRPPPPPPPSSIQQKPRPPPPPQIQQKPKSRPPPPRAPPHRAPPSFNFDPLSGLGFPSVDNLVNDIASIF